MWKNHTITFLKIDKDNFYVTLKNRFFLKLILLLFVSLQAIRLSFKRFPISSMFFELFMYLGKLK